MVQTEIQLLYALTMHTQMKLLIKSNQLEKQQKLMQFSERKIEKIFKNLKPQNFELFQISGL